MSTSSSTTITASTVNGTTRITGLSSGIDVDSLVETLMDAEKSKLNKLKQQQQLAEWRQEAYQTITDKIATFADTYFSTTSSSSLIRTTTYSQFTASSDSSAVTVSSDTTATAGTHTVAVSSLASASTLKGGTLSIQGDSTADYSTAQGESLTITLDGTSYTVSLDSSITDVDTLQDAIDAAVGEGKVVVSESSGVLSVATGDGVYSVTLSGAEALSALGLGDGSQTSLSNILDTDATLEELADSLADAFTFTTDDDGDEAVVFTINGEDFSFKASEYTLEEMISEINDSDAGVTMKYASSTNKLVLTADTLGAGNTVTTSETGSTFLSTLLGNATAGSDAKVTVDGTGYTLAANELTVDGVTYTFNKVTTEDAVVTIAQDTDSIYDAIIGFVDAYNTLIEEINAELSADYDYDYPPLTDAQKEEMSDDEIEEWEEKAKSGLLEDDSILEDMLADLREAIMDPVSGVGTYLEDIGITFSSEYSENGKLSVDETTLRTAIESDAATIMNMFAQKSTSYSDNSDVRDLSSSERAVRYQEEGIAYRFYDVLQDNIATTQNSSGNYGLLIEKAGSSTTTYENTLETLIEDYQEKIDAEEDRLEDKEDYYYEKYTAMETYLSEISSEYESFLSMFSDDS